MATGNASLGKSVGHLMGASIAISATTTTAGQTLIQRKLGAISSPKLMQNANDGRLRETARCGDFHQPLSSDAISGAATVAYSGTCRTLTSEQCARNSSHSASVTHFLRSRAPRHQQPGDQQHFVLELAFGSKSWSLKLLHQVPDPIRAQILEDVDMQSGCPRD